MRDAVLLWMLALPLMVGLGYEQSEAYHPVAI